MKFITEILKRRIPQILGSYLFAGSSLILFIDWLVARYAFPEYYVTLVLFGIISILPSVVILSYFHGAPGKDEWTKIEKIGIPINVIFIAGIVLIGYQQGIWNKNGDSRAGNIHKEPKTLYIAPILSDLRYSNYSHLLPKMLHDEDFPFENFKYDSLTAKETEDLYSSIINKTIPFLGSEFYYLTHHELIEKMGKVGQTTPDYNLNFEYAYIGNILKKDPLDYYDVLDNTITGSTPEFQLHTDTKHMVYFNVIKLIPPYNEQTLLVNIHVQHIFGNKVENIEENDEHILKTSKNSYFLFHHSTFNKIILTRENSFGMDIAPILHQHLKSYQSQISLETIFSVEINSIKGNDIAFNFIDKDKKLKIGTELKAIRGYHSDNKGVIIRISDLEAYKKKVDKIPEIAEFEQYYNRDNFSWSENELQQLNDGNHFLSKINRGYTQSLGYTIKITQLMDSTGLGIIIDRESGLITLKPGDNLNF